MVRYGRPGAGPEPGSHASCRLAPPPSSSSSLAKDGQSTTVTVKKAADSGYGIGFGGARDAQDPPGVYLDSVTPEASAANRTLGECVGWQVTKVNTLDMSGATADLKVLKLALASADGADLVLTLRANAALTGLWNGLAGASTRTTAPVNTKEVTVDVVKRTSRSAPGFGLTFGGADSETDVWVKGPGVYIKSCPASSSAKEGWQVVKVGEVDLVNATQATVGQAITEFLKASPGSIKFTLRNNPNLLALYKD